MRLRALELTNVRRFADQTARLGPFGDGLTTVTAENESGKSTFFDALHALFFVGHTSSAQEVKSLQPYSGGAVRIAAEIEMDGRGYRVEKSFLAQKSARVTDLENGQIVAQQGDAEAWIEARVGQAGKGPQGLLWVRQGAVDVDPAGKAGEHSVEVRRDLMSSVRGQIDAVTGGRRMDKIVARCRAELAELATSKLKPKTGGAWRRQEEEAIALAEELERLDKNVAALSQALEIKRKAAARLRALQDPEARAARDAQIAEAKAALDDAQAHDRSVRDALKAKQLVAAEKAGLDGQIRAITDLQARRAGLVAQLAEHETRAEKARTRQAAARQALESTRAEITRAEAERRTQADALKTARETERTAQSWARLRSVAAARSQIEAPMARLRAAEAVLTSGQVSQKDHDEITALSRKIAVAREMRRAQFAQLSILPEPGSGGATLDGTALAAGDEVLIDRAMDLRIEGFGTVALRPAAQAGQSSEDIEAFQARLAAGLAAHGVDSLEGLEQAVAARRQAETDKQVARAEIGALAPEGADSLTSEWTRLCGEVGHDPGSPLPEAEGQDSGNARVGEIEDTITDLDAELDILRADLAELQDADGAATAELSELEGVLRHLTQEQAGLAAPEDEAARLAALRADQASLAQAEAEAQAALAALQAEAPNLDAAQAAYERLQSAERADQEEVQRWKRELDRATGAIETQSEGAVEEKQAEVAARLATARERAQRYEMQARALALLIDHLEAARRDAQETYFEPIRTELMPLLSQLHPGAAFELDPDKMLVGKIVRDGVADEVSVLSGGAYEQIAILTRLAFARLFAKQGQHVPVILDDALVHTDDARIVAMFNMLSQVARDQQIIVLSCRTRAFSDLGGTRAFIEVGAS